MASVQWRNIHWYGMRMARRMLRFLLEKRKSSGAKLAVSGPLQILSALSAVFLSYRVARGVINISTGTFVEGAHSFLFSFFFLATFFPFISLTTRQELISPMRNEPILSAFVKTPLFSFLSTNCGWSPFANPRACLLNSLSPTEPDYYLLPFSYAILWIISPVTSFLILNPIT